MTKRNTQFNPIAKRITFPNLYSVDYLRMNNKLNSLKLKSINKVEGSTLVKVQINFEIMPIIHPVDVYLYLNNRKKDMFYLVPSGKYNFKLKLVKGTHTIKLFYVEKGYKSPSINKSIVIE